MHHLLFGNPLCKLAHYRSRTKSGVVMGMQCAISISGIEILTLAASERLRHSVVVSEADSLAFISGDQRSLHYIDNCCAESAQGIFKSLPLV